MKYGFLILLIGFSFNLCAQQPVITTPLQFERHFYDLEDQWAVFPKNEKTGKYPFGFIYMDLLAGFSFRLEGSFEIDPQGHIFRDSTDYLKTAMYTYRLGRNTKPVYAIPDNILSILGVKQYPEWLHIYKRDTNLVATKVSRGKWYNDAGQIQKALIYLEDAYKTDPHAKGLEFELTYSYNELKEYNKAVEVLNGAIKNSPNEALLYRELGYSYMKENDTQNAIKTYLKGIDMVDQHGDMGAKAEMAWNLAVIYREQNNDSDYKKWGQKAKDWAPSGSEMAKRLSNVTF
jgi:tetratricopeptide (TPR) repeat protein